jgi:DNA polymerase phi
LDAPQVKDILKLALSAVRQTKRLNPDSEALSSTWRPQQWDSLRTKLASSDKLKSSTSLQTMCNQIIQLCGGSYMCAKYNKHDKKTPPAKRKVEGTDEAVGKKKAKKAKRAKKEVEVEEEMEMED